MKLTSLGKVAVASAGTIKQVTTDATILASHIRIELVAGNTGDIHIGTSALVKATGVGVISVLAKASPERWVYELSVEGNTIQLAQFYLDSGTNGDGAFVSYGVA